MTPTFSFADIFALAPFLLLFAGALILLLLESFFEKKSRALSGLLAVGVFAAAFFSSFFSSPSSNPLLTRWIHFDSLSLFFSRLFLGIGLASVAFSFSFFERLDSRRGEFYFLLLACVFGLLLIGQSADFLTLFIGLETLSLSLYILCAFVKSWKLAREAAIKYFFMGALATSFFLFGVALIYGAVGTTHFTELLGAFRGLKSQESQLLFLSGVALVTLGLSFKAALVPFHAWAPDVYAGAPTPVVAFMAVGTKAGAFAAFARLFLQALPESHPAWNQTMLFFILATLLYANWVALRQTELRRFFAYSSISHAGFLMIPVVAQTAQSLSALQFYLVIYTVATVGAFAVLVILDKLNESFPILEVRGLFRRSPILAVIFALSLLTLAGIPPSAGFLAKFYLFKVAYQAGYLSIVLVGLLTSILAAFYYLRIVMLLFADEAEPVSPLPRAWPAAAVAMVALGLLILFSFAPSLI